ncbi:MAG: Wzz/FepE/Etk N-terminal domain-containing protein, partial [Nitrospiria bacterium]
MKDRVIRPHLGPRDLLIGYADAVRRRKWSFLLPAVVLIGLTIPIVLTLPPVYKSTTLIMVEAQKVPQEFVKTTVSAPIEDRLKTISQQILSRTRLERVIEEFGLDRPRERRSEGRIARWLDGWRAPAKPEAGRRVSLAVVEGMQRQIDINVKGGSTFSVSYMGEDPEMVMNVTNKLASLFIEENLKVREEQAEGTAEFLESELQQVKTRLESQEEELRTFKERYTGELPGQLDTNLRTLDRLQTERQRLQDSLRFAEDRYALFTQQLAAGLPEGERTAPTLSLHLQSLRVKLANLRTEYKDEYPDIAALKKEIAEVEAELAARQNDTAGVPGKPGDYGTLQAGEQQREIKLIKQRQQAVGDQIREYEKRVDRTPLREQQLTQVLRDYENTRKSYQALLDKRQDARIAESLERRQKGEIFRVLDPANYPERPFKPNRLLLVLGCL